MTTFNDIYYSFSPTGSGKRWIAAKIGLLPWQATILTKQKSLQDQYV